MPATPHEPTRPNGSLVRHDLRRSLAGGAVALVVGAVAIFGVGSITSFEARILVEAVQPGVRFLASAAVAAGTTVLALMLTLIGLTFSSPYRFRSDHYRRIRNASMLSTVLIVTSTLIMLFLAVPIEEADALNVYYQTVYYGLVLAIALVGGLIVALVLMLNFTLRSLAAVGLGYRSWLIDHDEDGGTYSEPALPSDDQHDIRSRSKPSAG